MGWSIRIKQAANYSLETVITDGKRTHNTNMTREKGSTHFLNE